MLRTFAVRCTADPGCGAAAAGGLSTMLTTVRTTTGAAASVTAPSAGVTGTCTCLCRVATYSVATTARHTPTATSAGMRWVNQVTVRSSASADTGGRAGRSRTRATASMASATAAENPRK